MTRLVVKHDAPGDWSQQKFHMSEVTVWQGRNILHQASFDHWLGDVCVRDEAIAAAEAWAEQVRAKMGIAETVPA